MGTLFSQWLKERRKTLDLTQQELATRVGCSVIAIRKIESGERRPSQQLAELLARFLDVPIEEGWGFVEFARTGVRPVSLPRRIEQRRPPNNLPAPPNPLIGRENEVIAVVRLLARDTTRLVTLLGPPGIGKTRLGIAIAEKILADFPDGVFFIALAPITDAHLVGATIANILKVPDGGPQTALERLEIFLRDKQTLLVLDNFEQILAAAPQIGELLAACPWLKLLITSRAPLHIRSERQFPVSPLALPDLEHLPDVEGIGHCAAVALFLERAQAVKPDFSLNVNNATAVAALCAWLDGLPLAIELISARVKLLPPETLLERRGGRLLLQSDGMRDFESRHQTLNAAIGWSYQLLNAEEQTLFRRLGAFVGGWTLEAAETVFTDHPQLNALDGLSSLVDKNLVNQTVNADGEPRFTMLETIREYALGQLVTSGEVEDVRQRHMYYFITLAERAETRLFGPESQRWLNLLESELDNFRTSLNWISQVGDIENGLRLAGALGWFWNHGSHWKEGREWLVKLLDSGNDISLPVRAKAFHHALELSYQLSDYLYMAARYEEGLALAREMDDPRMKAWLLAVLGYGDPLPGEHHQRHLEEALMLFRMLGDQWGICETIVRFQRFCVRCGDYVRADELQEEGIRLARRAGDKLLLSWLVFMSASSRLMQGKIDARTESLYQDSLAIFDEIGDKNGIAAALYNLGAFAGLRGDDDQARAFLSKSLELCKELGSIDYAVLCLVKLAEIYCIHGEAIRGAKLLGALSVLIQTILSGSGAFDQYTRTQYEHAVSTLHNSLEEAMSAAAWAEGQALTLEQAEAYALSLG